MSLDRIKRYIYISGMDWKKIISEIVATGMTQSEIAKEIDIKQPSVSAIASGETADPKWSTARRLLDLHKRRCGAEKQEAA